MRQRRGMASASLSSADVLRSAPAMATTGLSQRRRLEQGLDALDDFVAGRLDPDRARAAEQRDRAGLVGEPAPDRS